ncbi:uncharacterized protein LOC103834748 isoform X2 [Brassica rapa]|uniref:uncharacterized protein LOC103834748 isoform X2 n=1 Tax=Brassica campestris TaxID=3711 RepID=UPI0008731034|nr:uncharacterized protein LOC103834748 isoform X2 [Brassica rapa]
MQSHNCFSGNFKHMVLHLMCQVFEEAPARNLFLLMLYMFQCKCCWGCQVEILMGEGEDTALIVVFDSAMTKLTCVRAAEGQGDQDPADYEFPQLLQDIVGNTYIFHLKLNEANFSSHHKSFTVARIFDHNERISGPTFAPHGGGNNHDDDMHGSNCASCKYHLGDSSTGGNPPEAGDEPIETSDAVQPTSNTEQKESIVENVDDPHGSPTENKSKKC